MSILNRRFSYALGASLLILLSACATEPPPRRSRPAARVVEKPPAPAPVTDTNVYSYPTKGQSADRHDRDRYECHLWAVKQSGFDPSGPNVPPHQRVQVVANPAPGTSTAAGAFTGAAIGAAVSRYGEAAEGAIVGAVIGGALGAADDAARSQQAQRIEDRINASEQRSAALIEQKASGYRRAVGACLEGRGYNVR